MSKQSKRPFPPALTPLATAVIAFLIDLNTPNGVLDGFLYVFTILACQRLANERAPLIAALGVMPMMVLGFLLSPMAAPFWMAVTNRCVAALIVWLTALVLWHTARTANNRESTLTAAVMAARDDRASLGDWLRSDVGLELDQMERRLHRFALEPERPVVDLRTESLILRRAIRRAREAVHSQALRLAGR